MIKPIVIALMGVCVGLGGVALAQGGSNQLERVPYAIQLLTANQGAVVDISQLKQGFYRVSKGVTLTGVLPPNSGTRFIFDESTDADNYRFAARNNCSGIFTLDTDEKVQAYLSGMDSSSNTQLADVRFVGEERNLVRVASKIATVKKDYDGLAYVFKGEIGERGDVFGQSMAYAKNKLALFLPESGLDSGTFLNTFGQGVKQAASVPPMFDLFVGMRYVNNLDSVVMAYAKKRDGQPFTVQTNAAIPANLIANINNPNGAWMFHDLQGRPRLSVYAGLVVKNMVGAVGFSGPIVEAGPALDVLRDAKVPYAATNHFVLMARSSDQLRRAQTAMFGELTVNALDGAAIAPFAPGDLNKRYETLPVGQKLQIKAGDASPDMVLTMLKGGAYVTSDENGNFAVIKPSKEIQPIQLSESISGGGGCGKPGASNPECL